MSNDVLKGIYQLKIGSNNLLSGYGELGKGLSDLKDGTSTLRSSLQKGADDIQAIKANDSTYDMIVSPVETTKTEMTTVENNGHGMAPYMMCVGLWVGCISLCTGYSMSFKDDKKNMGKSGISLWFKKAKIFVPLAIVQATLMVLMLHILIGFNPANFGLTLLVGTLISLSFMSLIVFVSITFNFAGSYLLLLFLVLQLACSAGTYPLVLSGNIFAKLNIFMPFSYAVNSLRATVSGGNLQLVDLIVLVIIFIGFAALSVLVYHLKSAKYKKSITREK